MLRLSALLAGDLPTSPQPESSLTDEEFMLEHRASLVEVPVAEQVAEGAAA